MRFLVFLFRQFLRTDGTDPGRRLLLFLFRQFLRTDGKASGNRLSHSSVKKAYTAGNLKRSI